MKETKTRLTNHEKKSPEELDALNRAILSSALDCVIIMDAQGRVVEFNPAAEQTFGFTRAHAVGQELAELIIPPELRERHRRGLAHYLATGEGPVIDRRIEIAAMRADGTEILVELAITAFRLDGAPVFSAYLRDITERVRTERRRAAQYSIVSLLAGSWSLGRSWRTNSPRNRRQWELDVRFHLALRKGGANTPLRPHLAYGRGATQILRSDHAPDAVQEIGRAAGTRS